MASSMGTAAPRRGRRGRRGCRRETQQPLKVAGKPEERIRCAHWRASLPYAGDSSRRLRISGILPRIHARTIRTGIRRGGCASILESQRCFEAREDGAREKYYCLSMFPYPSGRCTWDMCAITPSRRLEPFHAHERQEFLQPMGWDAFGLPAENAAMANGVPPANDLRQHRPHEAAAQIPGIRPDWSRELATCRPTTTAGTSGCSAHAGEGHRL